MPARRGLAALCLLVACAASTCGACARETQDPRTIPLVDQRGTSFRLADMRGRPTFVTFIASRCTDACPIADAEFALLAKSVARERSAHLVTITLDPDYDTPFVMAAVAARFGANPNLWRLASGRAADIRRLMRAFGVVAEVEPNGVPGVHATFVFFLDARVRLRRTLLLSTTFERDAASVLSDRSVRARAPRPPTFRNIGKRHSGLATAVFR